MEALTSYILSQAKYLLKQTDEFYPFAAVIDKAGEIKPLGIYFGVEYPDSIQVLKKLEELIIDGIKRKDYLTGAIGIDVYIHDKNHDSIEKKSAVEIRIYNNIDSSYSTSHFVYSIKNDEYIVEAHNK